MINCEGAQKFESRTQQNQILGLATQIKIMGPEPKIQLGPYSLKLKPKKEKHA